MIEEEQISKGCQCMWVGVGGRGTRLINSHSHAITLAGWDRTLHAHLMALASNPVETLWPRDTLFKLVAVHKPILNDK